LDERALCLRIDSSKVSGPGKRIKTLYAYVSREAYLAHPEWLQEGHRLFDELAGHVPRDYMIPLPTADFESVRRGPALYADMLAMSRALLRELRRGPDPDECPDADCWERPLLEAELAGFWSEHGDRAQLISWAACCGFNQSSLDALGRWRAGASDEYIRTSKALVLEAQGVVARTVREGRARKDPVGEETLLESIGFYLKERGLNDDCISAQLRRLQYFGGGSPAPAIERNALQPAPEEADTSADETGMSLPYFVVVTRRAGIRRLHRLGGCSTRPGVGAPHFEEFSELPGPAKYTAVCKTCWKGGVVKGHAPRAVDSDGSSATSESSSSAPSST